jgi:hypothetical protein
MKRGEYSFVSHVYLLKGNERENELKTPKQASLHFTAGSGGSGVPAPPPRQVHTVHCTAWEVVTSPCCCSTATAARTCRLHLRQSIVTAGARAAHLLLLGAVGHLHPALQRLERGAELGLEARILGPVVSGGASPWPPPARSA